MCGLRLLHFIVTMFMASPHTAAEAAAAATAAAAVSVTVTVWAAVLHFSVICYYRGYC